MSYILYICAEYWRDICIWLMMMRLMSKHINSGDAIGE